MAMARTVFSPRCWATSSTRRNGSPVRWSVLVVYRALRMAGRCPSNSTSTTAPMIWTTRPVATPGGRAGLAGAVRVSVMVMCLFVLQGLGAGDDLDQLLGDLRLA